MRFLIWFCAGLLLLAGLVMAVGWALPASREGRAEVVIVATPAQIVEVIADVEAQAAGGFAQRGRVVQLQQVLEAHAGRAQVCIVDYLGGGIFVGVLLFGATFVGRRSPTPRSI